MNHRHLNSNKEFSSAAIDDLIGRGRRDYWLAEKDRRIHFAVMAIESAARKMGISSVEMHNRLFAQGLIHNRLLARYEDLHSQSVDWVADDTIETLKNWEAGE